jgi:hypothetical protein
VLDKLDVMQSVDGSSEDILREPCASFAHSHRKPLSCDESRPELPEIEGPLRQVTIA